VLGVSVTPSYAQLAVADPAQLVRKPAMLSWEVAGSLAGAGGAAWTALERLGITEGETLLVHASAGGVGTARNLSFRSVHSGHHDAAWCPAVGGFARRASPCVA
jgi:hypothetical protein